MLITTHFLQLHNELNFFSDFDRIIMHVETNSDPETAPKLSFYELKIASNCEPDHDNYFELYFNDEFPYDEENIDFGDDKSLTIKGCEYRLVSISYMAGDFAFKDTPILTACYEILKKKLEKVTKELRVRK